MDALARKVGVTENAIRKLEAGDTMEPRFSTAVRIADALGAAVLASVVRQIRSCREQLGQSGIKHVMVFGSVARGDASPGSDVDVMVEPSRSAQFTLIDLVSVSELLNRAIGRRVDVLTVQTVRQSSFGPAAIEEAVNAF